MKYGQLGLFVLTPTVVRLLDEPTLFLFHKFVDNPKRSSKNTWAAAGNALKSWFEFLLALGVTDWRKIGREEMACYRDLYLSTISPRTGQRYSTGTISGRMLWILEFYR